MIALDTSVLVRFLVEDDPRQTAQARALLRSGVAQGEVFYIADIVLCEVVWVLSSSYGLPRQKITVHLGKLLNASHLAFSSSERLSNALQAFAEGRGDFADYLIREHALAAGCSSVATFDKAVLQEPGFMSV